MVRHVVAAERQHRERIAPDRGLVIGRGGRLGAHGRREIDAVLPVERLEHQGEGAREAPAEHEGRNRHAGRIFPRRIDAGALRDRDREARIGMRRGPPATGRPVLAAPIDQMRRRRVGHSFPPHIAVVGQRDIGEDDVAREHLDRVGIGLGAGARRDAEESRFRIDGAQRAVRLRLDPGDVVADRPHGPAFERGGRDHHREVGLAARRRERRGDIGLVAVRALDTKDQHVLGKPALLAPHQRGDAQREAFLAQQRVAAIARTVRHDRVLLGELDDVLVLLVARPGDVLLPGLERRANGMEARHEVAVAQEGEHGPPQARHHAHADRDVGGISELHADMRDGRAQRPHAERDHVGACGRASTPSNRRSSVACISFGIDPASLVGLRHPLRAPSR